MSRADLDPGDATALRELREIAEEAARAGGAVARQRFGEISHVRLKADRSEVSDADEAAQEAVIECLRARRPDDALIAEESLAQTGDQGQPQPSNDAVCWVIDPLDGTRNYIRGIPLYTCAVAAMLHGFPIAGAIYVPPEDRLLSASCAEGFLIDGQPAPERERPIPSGRSPKPIVAIPSNFSHHAEKAILSNWLGRVVFRNLGVTSLHLALVAAGRLDAALLSDACLWDIAAGALFIDTTGGVLTDLGGLRLFPLDLAEYRAERLPCLGARDAETLADLTV